MARIDHDTMTVERKKLVACMTCSICNELFTEATTISECLDTFCKDCIYQKIEHEDLRSCPVCKVDLGCVPRTKLRPDSYWQDMREKLFPPTAAKPKSVAEASSSAPPALRRSKRSPLTFAVRQPIWQSPYRPTARRSRSARRKNPAPRRFIPITNVEVRLEIPESSETSIENLPSTKKIDSTAATSRRRRSARGKERIVEQNKEKNVETSVRQKEKNVEQNVNNKGKNVETNVRQKEKKGEKYAKNKEKNIETNGRRKEKNVELDARSNEKNAERNVEMRADLQKTVKLPMEAAASKAKSLNSPVEAAGSKTKSVNSPVEAAASKTKSVNSPVEAAASKTKSVNSPVETAASKTKSVNSPKEAAASKTNSENSPVEAAVSKTRSNNPNQQQIAAKPSSPSADDNVPTPKTQVKSDNALKAQVNKGKAVVTSYLRPRRSQSRQRKASPDEGFKVPSQAVVANKNGKKASADEVFKVPPQAMDGNKNGSKASANEVLKVPPQAVVEKKNSKPGEREAPIWLSLVAAEDQKGSPPLMQLPSCYLSIKDINMPISFVRKYIAKKLRLLSPDEVELSMRGKPLLADVQLQQLFKFWMKTASPKRFQSKVGASAKDYMMVLTYGRKANAQLTFL